MSNNEIHQLHSRIKYLLFHCKPTLKDLLEHFVKTIQVPKTSKNSETSKKLWQILQENRTEASAIKNFDHKNYARWKKIEISELSIQEICGILLSEKLEFMKSICCCTKCCHECMTCVLQEGGIHLNKLECYKKRCKECGANASGECRKEAFVQSLILIEQLCETIDSIQNPDVYEEFSQEERPLPQLHHFKTWRQLWTTIQRAMATICDFLVSEGSLEKEKWKDREMEIRIVLKKTIYELNGLYRYKMVSEQENNTNRCIDPEEESN